MTLLAIPNVSEGRRPAVIERMTVVVGRAGARVLDVHSDPAHNRSVITASAETPVLVAAMEELARTAAGVIDLTKQTGTHPRLGCLDVCPIVRYDTEIAEAIEVAREIGAVIGDLGIPVYLYGDAAMRDATRELPGLRRGGLAALILKAAQDLPPDFGPRRIDPKRGVVCVGARDVLIAFNVWLSCRVEVARDVAAEVRESSGGRPGVRALGLSVDASPTSQVSMNLTAPDRTDIDEAYVAVADRAHARGVRVIATEIVGLVPQRFLPDPDAEAARLLMAPGRSLEAALTD